MADNQLRVLVTGPYITNYSLAKVNRGFAQSLARVAPEFAVGIWQEPNFQIDKLPDATDLQRFPGVSPLLTNDTENIDVTIMSHYPASPQQPYGLKDLPGKAKLMIIAWEETVFPADKVAEINEHLHGMIACSTFVKQIMRRNGVRVPIMVAPNGIDDDFRNLTPVPGGYKINTNKRFKFLHISTAKPRKGVDVLLKAYFDEFTGQDDVTLIIKSFPGPENIVNDLIGKLNSEYPDPPEVIHINDPGLTEQDIVNLTVSCDCTVYPTRAEGFGLPIAEAMYLGVPVIATGYGGYLDFFSAENGWPLPFKITAALDSESTNIGARWADPDAAALRQRLRELFEIETQSGTHGTPEAKTERDLKIELARQAVETLSWDNTAAQTRKFIQDAFRFSELKHKEIAVLTTINTVCGIAEYSRDLYTGIQNSFKKFTYLANADVADRIRPDSGNIERLWEYGEQTFSSVLEWLAANQPDIFHIQLHAGGHFPLSGLNRLLAGIEKLPRRPQVVITPHTVSSPSLDLVLSKDYLEHIEKILIHKQDDLDHLAAAGLTNLELFQLPFDEFPVRSRDYLKSRLSLAHKSPIVITHGLVSSHKGLLQTAGAIAILKHDYPDILWLAVNAVNINNSTSAATFAELKELITQLALEEQVRLFPEFLDSTQISTLLQAADVGVLAYDERGESASAAVRKFLASGTPTIVTNIPMMGELKDEVLKINSNAAETIAAGIKSLIEDIDLRHRLSTAALDTSKAANWDSMGIRLLDIYSELTTVNETLSV